MWVVDIYRFVTIPASWDETVTSDNKILENKGSSGFEG